MKSVAYTLLALLFFSCSAFASGPSLTFAQSSDGTVFAVYATGACPVGTVPNPDLVPAVTISGGQINISSNAGIASDFGGCNPQSNPGFLLPASLGKLSDGHYTVVWSFNPNLGQTTGAFDIAQNSLVVANCGSLPHPSAISGSWYDPGYSGSGFSFQMSGSGLFVTYYGWDATGNHLWLVSDAGPTSLAINTPIVLNMSYATGGTFDRPQHNLARWGLLVVNFTSCQAATARLSGRSGNQNLSLTQLIGIAGLPGC